MGTDPLLNEHRKNSGLVEQASLSSAGTVLAVTATVAITPGSCSTPISQVLQQSMSSASTPASNSGLSCVESWASNFDVPWKKMNSSFIRALESKKRPKKCDLLDCVRKVSDEIEMINKKPSASNLGVIAAAMVAKYPDSLADSLTGVGVLGDGCVSLRQRLTRQFENRNRGYTNSVKKRLLEFDSDDERSHGGTSKPKRVSSSDLQRDSYGCVNWQPADLPNGETIESQREKKEWLIQEFKKASRDELEVKRCMDLTYVSQRTFINKDKPLVCTLTDHWPFLLQSEHMLTHFDILMGFSLTARADLFFDKKGLSLFNYGENYGSRSVQRLTVSLASVSRHQKSDKAKTIGSVLLLPGLLKEDSNEIFKSYADGTVVREMLESATAHPHIVFQGDVPFGDAPSYVVFEGQAVCGPVEFRIAFLTLFAMYYVLNLAYPACIAATLEFVQRVIGQINPDRGSKRAKQDSGKKCHSKINTGVLRLVNCLKDFESPWSID